MRLRPRQEPPEDPNVRLVEQILAAASTGSWEIGAGNRARAENALWLCGCFSTEDAPIWLIHDGVDEGIGWCRLPDGAHEDDLVDAQRMHGDHVQPHEVLRWLRGERPHPYGFGDERDDPGVSEAIRSRIVQRPPN